MTKSLSVKQREMKDREDNERRYQLKMRRRANQVTGVQVQLNGINARLRTIEAHLGIGSKPVMAAPDDAKLIKQYELMHPMMEPTKPAGYARFKTELGSSDPVWQAYWAALVRHGVWFRANWEREHNIS